MSMKLMREHLQELLFWWPNGLDDFTDAGRVTGGTEHTRLGHAMPGQCLLQLLQKALFEQTLCFVDHLGSDQFRLKTTMVQDDSSI